MNKKLLFVVNVDWFFISHRLPIALKAIEKGYEVHLACAYTDHEKWLKSKGIVTHSLVLNRSGVNPINELKLLFCLHKVISKVKPDAVHLVTVKPVIYGCLIARVNKIRKIIVSISGLGFIFTDEKLKSRTIRNLIIFLYRVLLNKTNIKVIFQNKDDMSFFIDHKITNAQNTILTYGSGVDLDKFNFYEEEILGLKVMFVSRLLKTKGLIEFVKAAEIFKDRYDINVDFILVGKLDKANPSCIAEAELNNWIKTGSIDYWGHHNDVAQVIKQSHLIVLPSYREGMPKILLEASAIGRAIITTDIPGCREIIQNNKSGMLIEPKNVEALVDAIYYLLTNEKVRKQLALEGRRRAEQLFDQRQVVDTCINLY